MANNKAFELPSGEPGLTTVFVVLLRRSTGGMMDNADGVFRANPAQMGKPATEGLAGVYGITENRTVWPDDVYAAFFYDNQGGPNDPATSRLLGKDEGPVENDLRLAPYSPSLPPSELLDKVKALVQDSAAKLSAADWNNGIAAALGRYSRHRPDAAVADITGNGTHLYALPVAWVAGFSSIKSIEYPIGDNPETLLDSDEFGLYTSPTETKIRLVNDAPPATKSLRVAFTIPRVYATIADGDLDAVAHLAASVCLGMLASLYLGTSDPTIAVDSVNYRSKSQECASRAKSCLTFYNDHLGIRDDNAVPAASAVSSREINYPGGGDRLTHPRRDRRTR